MKAGIPQIPSPLAGEGQGGKNNGVRPSLLTKSFNKKKDDFSKITI
jgi:hypothetical protein